MTCFQGFHVKYTKKLRLLHNIEAICLEVYVTKNALHQSFVGLGDLLKYLVQFSVSWSLLAFETFFLLMDSTVVKCSYHSMQKLSQLSFLSKGWKNIYMIILLVIEKGEECFHDCSIAWSIIIYICYLEETFQNSRF